MLPPSFLLVDDDETHRYLLRQTLANGELGADVEEAATTREAIAALRSRSFDCALVDYRLPDGDAFEILRELTGENRRPSIPVFVLSSVCDERIGTQLLAAGAEEYLVKTEILNGTLAPRITSALERSRSHDHQDDGEPAADPAVEAEASTAAAPSGEPEARPAEVTETRSGPGDRKKGLLRHPRRLAAGAALALLAAALWWLLASREHARIERAARSEAEAVRDEIEDCVEAHLLELVRMGQRWVRRGGTPKKDWVADATLYVSYRQTLRALEWVDSGNRVRWIVPEAGNEAALGLDLSFEKRRRATLEAARKERRLRLTRTIDLVQGEKGLLAFYPLFVGEQLDGYLVEVMSVPRILDPIVATREALGFSVAVFDGEDEIYGRYGEAGPDEASSGHETEVELGNVTWRLKVWPR